MPNAPATPSNLYPSLYYDDAPRAIEFLCRAFGFEKRMVVPGPDGTVRHSELSLGSGVLMVASVKAERGLKSVRAAGGVTGAVCARVADPDAHFARAKAAGAVITQPLKDEDYGSRGYMCEDPEGQQWYFGTYSPGAWWDGNDPHAGKH
ncbi:MAG: VOC family protein [Planctomycetes bacterium]|nr:VOC family protein [Planctomycetota bacterium]